jgi:uncharacterized protein YpmS
VGCTDWKRGFICLLALAVPLELSMTMLVHWKERSIIILWKLLF